MKDILKKVSDQEIEKKAWMIDSQEEWNDYYNSGKMVGAKWMRGLLLPEVERLNEENKKLKALVKRFQPRRLVDED